jgi:hypothetical protein
MLLKRFIAGTESLFTSLGGERLQSPKARRGLLVFAALILLAGLYLSFRYQPGLLDRLEWQPALILFLLGVPLIILLSSLEFVVMGRILGRRIQMATAFEVTVIGAAANLLPIPGGAVARVTALKLAGAGLRESATTMVMMTIMWVGVALMFSGGAAIHLGSEVPGVVALAVGLGAVTLAFFFTGSPSATFGSTLASLALKVCLVMADGARIYLALSALGFEVRPVQALVLVAAGPLGSAVSIMPAGLGVREALAALLAPLAGLAAAAGFLAAALSRIIDLAVIAPTALWLAFRR